MFCPHCGSEAAPHAVVCVRCGGPLTAPQQMPSPPTRANPAAKPRIAFILLGLFVGIFGVHNFFAGYIGRGVAQLLITLLIGWLVLPLLGVWIWNIVEICVVDQDAEGVAFN